MLAHNSVVVFFPLQVAGRLQKWAGTVPLHASTSPSTASMVAWLFSSEAIGQSLGPLVALTYSIWRPGSVLNILFCFGGCRPESGASGSCSIDIYSIWRPGSVLNILFCFGGCRPESGASGSCNIDIYSIWRPGLVLNILFCFGGCRPESGASGSCSIDIYSIWRPGSVLNILFCFGGYRPEKVS